MRRASARCRRPTAPGGPASAEARTRAAETINRRCAATVSASGRAPVWVTAFKASRASMIWAAQHHPAGSAPLLGGGWAAWESTTAISSRSRWAFAQRVPGGRIAGVGGEGVVHQRAGDMRQHAGGVDRLLTPFAMTEQRGEP